MQHLLLLFLGRKHMSKGKSNWSKIASRIPAFQHIYTHVYFVHMYEYIYTYMPRFSASGFFGPSKCLCCCVLLCYAVCYSVSSGPPSVSSRHLGSHLITTRAMCVCVCAYSHTCTHMHSHPVQKRCTVTHWNIIIQHRSKIIWKSYFQESSYGTTNQTHWFQRKVFLNYYQKKSFGCTLKTKEEWYGGAYALHSVPQDTGSQPAHNFEGFRVVNKCTCVPVNIHITWKCILYH